MQNCASLAAGRSRSAKEAEPVSPRDWAGNRAPQSALFPQLPSTDRRNSTFCLHACNHDFWLLVAFYSFL